jgi:hypothetical protein
MNFISSLRCPKIQKKNVKEKDICGELEKSAKKMPIAEIILIFSNSEKLTYKKEISNFHPLIMSNKRCTVDIKTILIIAVQIIPKYLPNT